MAEPEGLRGLITSETRSRWPQRVHEEKGKGADMLLAERGGASVWQCEATVLEWIECPGALGIG
jgi:hypothetical protein